MEPQGKFIDSVQDDVDVSVDSKKKVMGWINTRTYENGVVIKTYYAYGDDKPLNTSQTVDTAINTAWTRGPGKPRTDVTYDVNGNAIKKETPPGGEPRVVETEQPKPTATTAAPPPERVNPADPTKRQVWNSDSRQWEDAGGVAPDTSKPPTERVNPADPTKRQVWNPTTGQWDDAGTVASAPVVGKRVDVNTETKRTTVTDTNGNTLEDRPATASELQTQGSGGTFQHVTRNGKTYVVSLGPNGEELGVQPSNIPAEEPKPQTSIIDPSKQQAVAIVNPTTGDVASKPIPGTGAKSLPEGFDPIIKSAFGSIVSDLQEKTKQLLELEKSDPNWNHNDTLKELDRLKEVAQASLNEQVGILNAQQNIRGQDIQQNATAVNAATNRLPFATNTANQAIDLIKMMGVGAGKLPPGSLDTFFKGYLDQQKGFANSIQALPDLSTTQVPRTPQQAELMGGQNPPISFNINIGGAGGGVSMPGINPVSSAPTLGADLGAGAIAQPNIPSPGDIPGAGGPTPGLMPNPSSMDEFFQQEASKPNQSPARMQALERIKAELGVSRQAPGMRWSGGQLRAPGYSAGV